GAAAAAAVLDRLGRGRPRPPRYARWRAATDAAPAPLAASGRRPHSQAHEAEAFARRRHYVLRTGAAAAARCGVRRRHHCGLPDRDRDDVCPVARSRRRWWGHGADVLSVTG